MFVNLINNVAFLISLVTAGQIVIDRFPQHSLSRRVLLGLLFGGIALLGMANPVAYLPGVFFDARSMVLVVAGVVGGGVTAAIAAGMAALYRYQLGGAGAPVGIFVALFPALLGALARQWWQRGARSPRLTDYLALGMVVQFIQLAAFTQIPNRAGFAFIEQAWWVLLLFYPLGTMLLCQIFRNHEKRLIDKEALESAQDAVLAEERASMQRFHAYFDHSIVGLAITSVEKGWIEVNDALCATLGYTREELTRMTWVELTHPQDLAADQAQFNRMLAGEIKGYAMDKRFIHKDGHVVDARLAVSHVSKPDGSLDYVVAMVEDVSERNQAVDALRRMVKDLGETQRIAHIGSWHLDLATNKVVWTEELFRMYGFDPSLPVPPYTEHMKLFTPASWEKLSAALAQTVKTGAPYTLELELVRKDGNTGWMWVRGEAEVDAVGNTVGLWGAAQDITERKKTELLMQEQLDELHRWQQTMLGREGRIISIKQEVNELLARTGQPPRYATQAPPQSGGTA
jgi:PAS domain S-box-containing protein